MELRDKVINIESRIEIKGYQTSGRENLIKLQKSGLVLGSSSWTKVEIEVMAK